MLKTLLWLGGSLILPCVLTVPLTASLTAPTFAQSITAAPDGTGTIITIEGNTYHIDGGTQAGANLFHSFQALGLSTGEIANFLSNPSITNILGRVTGGDPSIIDGLIQVTGANSNLYLMNPAGFVFGQGASLNVGGDFFATTADRIAVGDGWFMSTGVNDYASLVGTPNQFAFASEEPGTILNFGELSSSQNVSLIGGTVLNEGAIAGATVIIAAVPGERLVRISEPGMLLSLDIPTEQMAAGISPVDLPTLLTGSETLTNRSAAVPAASINQGNVVIAGNVSGQQVDLYAAGQVTPTNAALIEGDTRVVRFSETGENPNQGIFIDYRADNPEQLLYGAAAGTIAQIIETDENGVSVISEQLAEIADSVGELKSVAIVAEGNEGNFWLGNQWLHSENIGDYATQLQSWGQALTESADILLYSCFTALGATGDALVSSFANLTGADVAASVDVTGSSNYGGNWFLESSTETIEAGNPFAAETLNIWEGSLDIFTVATATQADLEQAIVDANNLTGADEIHFAPGVTSITLTSALSAITDDLMITGNGTNVTIQRSTAGGTPNFRIFDIDATNATIEDLTLTGGNVGGVHGGVIRHRGTGTLTVNNTTISGNRANFGGGIYSGAGNLTLNNATVSGNTAGFGGGIWSTSGIVTLENSSSVSNNTATSNAGGIRTVGNIYITDSTVSDNSAVNFTGGIRASANVTLTNSTVSRNSSPKSGAGIQTGSSANVTLINSTVSGNSTGQAGAGILGGGTIVLDKSSVSNNLAAGYAGGMRTNGNVEIKNNSTVSGNSGAGAGGGIWASAGDVTITDSTVSDNSAGSHAGGVRVQLGNLTVTNSTVSGNSAGDNGGGLRTHTGNITVTNSTVENNTSGTQGGGVFTNGGAITLTNTNILNNSANNFGGGVRSHSGNVVVTNSTVSANTSSDQGGGIINFLGNITVTNSTISNNSSAQEGGGLKTASGVITLTNNSTVTNNSAGAVGGGIHTTSGAVNLTNNSTVSGNSAGQGGGGIRTGAGMVTVTNSTVTSNTAANNGGGIATIAGAIILNNNSTVTSNRAGVDGGGVHTESGAIAVNNSTVSNNVAINDGGGIKTDSGAVNLTDNSTVSDNFASDDGGGIQTDSGTISVANSTISGNGASDRGGGLYAGRYNYTGGSINLTDSTLSGNFGMFGGGMAASGAEITAIRSSLSGNFAPAYQTLYTDKTNVTIIDHPGNLNLAVSAYEGNLFASASGSVTVTGRLNPLGGNLTVQAGSSIDLTPVQLSPTRGGDVTLTAGGDINTKNIFTAATNAGNGGSITLTSTGGAINTQSNGSSGSLDARAANGNGGQVTINAAKNISIGAINTEAFNGIGGAVTVESPDSFITIDGTVSSSFISFSASISSAGTNGGGAILIRHGGNGLVPFKVGDASINGTSAAITAGGSYTIGVGNSYLYSHTQPGIQILTDGAPAATSLPSILAGVEPINQTLTTATLLQMIAEQAGGKVWVDEGMGMTPDQDLAGFEIPGEGGWPLWGGSFEDEAFTSYVLSVDDFLTQQFETPSEDIVEPSKSEEKEDEEGSIANIREVFKEITEKTGTVPAIIYAFNQLEGLELIVITPDEHLYRTIVPEADRKALRSTIRTFRRRISSVRSDYLDSAQQLHDWFIHPIEDIIKDLNVDTLIFAMGEGLRGLPLAALHDGKQFLIENYSLGQIPSLSLINSRYESLNQAEVVAMGASQFETLQPLPAVPSELALVTSMQSGEHYLNAQFTWDNLERHSRDRGFDVVHLATHAAFRSGDASNSYIQLWGQEKIDVNSLRKLRWFEDPEVELLVLSACETALGDVDAELGFAGLAVQAGVKSALASLWQISDVGTMHLMSEFYEALANPDVTIKAEALRQAQLALLQGHGDVVEMPEVRSRLPQDIKLDGVDLSHPFYWSPFVLVGSPW